MARGTHCIIGAGFAGLGAAHALLERGVEVDVYEGKSDVGGNWFDGVYDSTHLITSRDSTGYLEFPMGAELPDFPHWEQVRDYLHRYSEEFDLRRRIRFGHEVIRVVPAGDGPAGNGDGTAGWLVTHRADGVEQTRHYAGVVVANGHHWDPLVPDEPGTFTGTQIHVKDYKRPADLTGPRVLVVGAGVSACDLAVESSRAFGTADISMRRTKHFLPKTLFGKPITDLNNPWMPVWVQRMFTGLALRVINGPFSGYGMPEPDHRLFDQQVTINSQMLYAMRHGQVRYRPDIERFDGSTVHFVDGTAADFDTIVWATGYRVSFPFLDRDVFAWDRGVPRRVAGMLPERVAGLYVFGLMQLRGGAGPMLSRTAQLLADLVDWQAHTDHPIGPDLARTRKADSQFFFSVPQMTRRTAIERRLVAGHALVARRRGRWTPVPDELTGQPVPAPSTRTPAVTALEVPR